MKITKSQQKVIDTSKEEYKKYGATFEVLGKSNFNQIVCQVSYPSYNKRVVIGKRGGVKWEASF